MGVRAQPFRAGRMGWWLEGRAEGMTLEEWMGMHKSLQLPSAGAFASCSPGWI